MCTYVTATHAAFRMAQGLIELKAQGWFKSLFQDLVQQTSLPFAAKRTGPPFAFGARRRFAQTLRDRVSVDPCSRLIALSTLETSKRLISDCEEPVLPTVWRDPLGGSRAHFKNWGCPVARGGKGGINPLPLNLSPVVARRIKVVASHKLVVGFLLRTTSPPTGWVSGSA